NLAETVTASKSEIYNVDDFAIYVPGKASTIRGVILALGGPDTRAFATDGTFGAPLPELEASLHILGKDLRNLADEQGLAILGTSQQQMKDGPQNDALIVKAIRAAAEKSGRKELTNVPILLYGISGGGFEASGFTARNPALVAGLFLKRP